MMGACQTTTDDMKTTLEKVLDEINMVMESDYAMGHKDKEESQ